MPTSLYADTDFPADGQLISLSVAMGPGRVDPDESAPPGDVLEVFDHHEQVPGVSGDRLWHRTVRA